MTDAQECFARQAALDLGEELRKRCGIAITTIGISERNGKPLLFVYWRSKRAAKQYGKLPVKFDGYPVEHKVMGTPRAL